MNNLYIYLFVLIMVCLIFGNSNKEGFSCDSRSYVGFYNGSGGGYYNESPDFSYPLYPYFDATGKHVMPRKYLNYVGYYQPPDLCPTKMEDSLKYHNKEVLELRNYF